MALELRELKCLRLDDLFVVVSGLLNPYVSYTCLEHCIQWHGVGILFDQDTLPAS